MATKHDEFKVYYFSFDEDELNVIVESLLAAGNEELAEKILEEMEGKCDDCDCDETESIASLKFDIDYSAATEARSELDKLAQSAREVIKLKGELDDSFFGLKRDDIDVIGVADLVADMISRGIEGRGK